MHPFPRKRWSRNYRLTTFALHANLVRGGERSAFMNFLPHKIPTVIHFSDYDTLSSQADKLDTTIRNAKQRFEQHINKVREAGKLVCELARTLEPESTFNLKARIEAETKFSADNFLEPAEDNFDNNLLQAAKHLAKTFPAAKALKAEFTVEYRL